jgi:hypothetical protein
MFTEAIDIYCEDHAKHTFCERYTELLKFKADGTYYYHCILIICLNVFSKFSPINTLHS